MNNVHTALSVILNIDQNNYISAGNEEAGALVVVHNQVAMPYPEDNAIVIRPGMLTSIHVSRVIEIKTLRICVCDTVSRVCNWPNYPVR